MAGSVVENLGRSQPPSCGGRVVVAAIVAASAAVVGVAVLAQRASAWWRKRQVAARIKARHKDLAGRVNAEFAQHYNHHDDGRG